MKLIKSIIFIILLLVAVQVEGWCATKYLRSVGGAWSDNATWSTTSNGAADTTAPTNVDNVVCDPNSGSAVLVIDTANCLGKNFDSSGFSGTIAFNGGDLKMHGDINFGAGITFSGSTGSIGIYSSGNLTTNNKILPVSFFVMGGTTTLADNLAISNTKNLNVALYTDCSFNSNNFNVTCGGFNAKSNQVKTITLGSSTVNCTSFDTSGTNLTFNYDTSTIILNQAATGAMSFSPGTAQFYNLTLNGYASTGCYKAFTGDLTVNNTLTIAGNSSTNKLALKSSDTTIRTITAPTVNLSNIDYYQNIKGAGDGWIGKVPFFNSASSWNPNLKYSGVLR